MISYIRGELVARTEDKVVVEVNGIGYGIFVPASVMDVLPSVGSELKLHTYLNVREDAMQLFGFNSAEALEVYKLVIGVNGIGPKGGLAILSALTINELRFAVASSDVKAISSAQGIGKKTAEKLIIELKDKLHIEDALDSSTEKSEIETSGTKSSGANASEAVQALIALGYDPSTALKAVSKVEDNGTLEVEDILKLALKNMMF